MHVCNLIQTRPISSKNSIVSSGNGNVFLSLLPYFFSALFFAFCDDIIYRKENIVFVFLAFRLVQSLFSQSFSWTACVEMSMCLHFKNYLAHRRRFQEVLASLQSDWNDSCSSSLASLSIDARIYTIDEFRLGHCIRQPPPCLCNEV